MALNERTTPTVKVDGDLIRAVREKKQLTQLYVAEVVGVTVDTVSRWENNRTATVRRENAESLARALETTLEEIVRKETGAAQEGAAAEDEKADPAVPAASPQMDWGGKRRTILTVAGLVLAALLSLWIATVLRGVTVSAARRLPPYAPPGTLVPVTIEVKAAEGGRFMVVVREKIPPGWTLVSSVPAQDQGPGPDGVTKWIIELDNGSGRVSAILRAPPARESTRHFFSGEVAFARERGRPVQISGPSRIDLEYVHWADEDADFRIDDSEVLGALERLTGLKDQGIDPADLRALWGAGVYSWDRSLEKFVVPHR